jgi:hypothetical protein
VTGTAPIEQPSTLLPLKTGYNILMGELFENVGRAWELTHDRNPSREGGSQQPAAMPEMRSRNQKDSPE